MLKLKLFSGSVHQQSLETRPAVFSTREGSDVDDDSYMGYSTVVGSFQEDAQYEGIAVGMPRGNHLRGKVGVEINHEITLLYSLQIEILITY